MFDPSKGIRPFIIHMLKWLALYFVVSIILALIIPFPWSFAAFVGVFLLIQFVRRYLAGNGSFGGFFSQPSSMIGSNPVKYYCMSCGHQHNDRSCPKCGSNMKRVG